MPVPPWHGLPGRDGSRAGCPCHRGTAFQAVMDHGQDARATRNEKPGSEPLGRGPAPSRAWSVDGEGAVARACPGRSFETEGEGAGHSSPEEGAAEESTEAGGRWPVIKTTGDHR